MDLQYLDRLRQGVSSWNKWKSLNSNLEIDFRGADLSVTDLSEADLSRVDFKGANLGQANLSRATLYKANLNYANLGGVDLTNANLNGAIINWANLNLADLTGASLIGADLNFTCLIGANLTGADLIGTCLNGACLAGANLGESDLSRANLRGANLTSTDLSNSNLTRSNLTATDLTGSNLIMAHLEETNFSGSILENADLIQARLWRTLFVGVDLSRVIGLDEVIHDGPSTVDIDSIYLSKGYISQTFLRGVGIPDIFLTYTRSLVNSPINYYSCFISYSSKDEVFANRLYADLQNNNVRCWFARENMKIGDHYHQRIDESIRLYDKLILVLSEHAVQSAWVERKVVSAREKEDQECREVLFPVRLDETVMQTTKAWAADIRRRWHIGNFTQWKDYDSYQRSFERLLRDLKA